MTDDSPRPLRAVEADASNPMTVDQLQSHGNTLLQQAARECRRALQASTKIDLLYEGRSYRIRDVEWMQREAEDARVKWANVCALLDEVVREYRNSVKRTGGGA